MLRVESHTDPTFDSQSSSFALRGIEHERRPAAYQAERVLLRCSLQRRAQLAANAPTFDMSRRLTTTPSRAAARRSRARPADHARTTNRCPFPRPGAEPAATTVARAVSPCQCSWPSSVPIWPPSAGLAINPSIRARGRKPSAPSATQACCSGRWGWRGCLACCGWRALRSGGVLAAPCSALRSLVDDVALRPPSVNANTQR